MQACSMRPNKQWHEFSYYLQNSELTPCYFDPKVMIFHIFPNLPKRSFRRQTGIRSTLIMMCRDVHWDQINNKDNFHIICKNGEFNPCHLAKKVMIFHIFQKLMKCKDVHWDQIQFFPFILFAKTVRITLCHFSRKVMTI